jgi:hypothetical protein
MTPFVIPTAPFAGSSRAPRHRGTMEQSGKQREYSRREKDAE